MLGNVNQEAAHEYRQRLRIHMHTWWTGTWAGPNSVTPPEVHQRNLQLRRQRRRERQKSSHALIPVDDGEPDNTDRQSLRDADYTDRQKQQAVEPVTSSSTQLASTPSWTRSSHNEPSHSSEGAQSPSAIGRTRILRHRRIRQPQK